MYTEIRFTLNGEQKLYQGDPLRRLLDVLREDYGLTGSKEGCGEGECGACSIIKNGELVTSCIIPVGEYLQSDCKRLIEYVVVDKDRTGSVKRFGNTSSSHATLIAAESGGIYALSVQGSGLIYGTTPDIAEQVTYVDDLTGSAAYKKYLAGIVFTLGR